MMLQSTIDLAGPVAHTMVGWLGTYLVHSTVLIGGVLAFTRCFTLDALTRSFLWKVSLVGGLFTASFQTGLGHQPWFGTMALADTALAPQPLPPAPPAPPTMFPCDGCGGDLLVIVDDGARTTVVAMPGFSGFDTPVPPAHATIADREFPVYLTGAPVLGLPAPPLAPTSAPALAAGDLTPRDRAALLALAGVFLTGAAVSLTRLGLTARRLRRALRGRHDVMEGPLRERFDRLMERARISLRQVRLTMSHVLASPLALAGGEIVVPERAEQLRPHQQEAMLAHELAHVVRRDPAWQLLAAAIEAVLWFQPLQRVARRGMQEAAEELSDDWAVRHTGSGVHLARCLAEVATWPAPEDSSLASPMAAGGKLLVRRVQRLLDARERDRGAWARRWRGLLGAALLAVVGLAAPGVSFAQPGDPPAPPVLVPDVPDVPPVPPMPVLAHVPDGEHGPRLVFAGPGDRPMLAMAHGPHAGHDDIVVVDSGETLTGRQRRLLRRAEKNERRAEKLRERSGVRHHVIRIHHPDPPAPPAPPSPPPHARVLHMPAPPAPPAPPRVRVHHPHIDAAALERELEAAAAAIEAAAEATGTIDPERLRHLEQQAKALAERLGHLEGLEGLDEDIRRELDAAAREAAAELEQAGRQLGRDLRSVPREILSAQQLRKIEEEAERAAEEAMRAFEFEAEADDAAERPDRAEIRRAAEAARAARTRAQAEQKRIRDEASRAADAARQKSSQK